MTQTISLNPTTDTLELNPVFARTPLFITAPVPTEAPAMGSYAMELWKRPYNATEAGAVPLAASVGYVAGGQVAIVFSAAQMDQVLSNEVNSNNFWLTIGGTDANGFPYSLRAGNLEIKPSGLSLIPVTTVSIAILNGVATFSFNGAEYSFDVVQTGGPPVTVDGGAVIVDGMIVVTVGGVSYTIPSVPT